MGKAAECAARNRAHRCRPRHRLASNRPLAATIPRALGTPWRHKDGIVETFRQHVSTTSHTALVLTKATKRSGRHAGLPLQPTAPPTAARRLQPSDPTLVVLGL